MTTIVRVLVLAVVFSANSAWANPRTDYVFERIIGEAVIPGFRALDKAAVAHAERWRAYCAAPTTTGRAQLVESFHALADRWAAIEIIQHGPWQEDFRNERFFFWPEHRNAVARALAEAQRRLEHEQWPQQALRGATAALQGLPALERLLFGDGRALPDSADRPVSCRLGVVIAKNVERLAHELHGGWRARADVISAEAKAALATDLVAAYAMIETRKIEAVIGKDVSTARPRAAEFWRSARSNPNILRNLEALNAINVILFEVLPETAALPDATQAAIAAAQSLSAPLGELSAGRDRAQVLRLHGAVDHAADAALAEIPAALGVTVGFNSLDGD